MRGLILKGIGGFYYVETEKGLIEAKGRGIFKKDGITLAVGDDVEITILEDDETKGVIEKIYPRKNCFIRPPIANVDAFFNESWKFFPISSSRLAASGTKYGIECVNSSTS